MTGDTDLDLPDEMFLVRVDHEETGDMRETLSFSRSPTVLLTFAANRFTRMASKIYQERYGLGAMDWRMLVMLTREPGATAARASETIGIDKAAISRCLHRLEGKDLVRAGALHANGRSRGWYLTAAGQTLHDTILREALERQRRLFQGFSKAEVEALCDMLQRFLENQKTLMADTTDPASE